VDDERSFLEGIARMVRRRRPGWELVLCTDPLEARDLATSQPLDAVMLDLAMPGAGGFEVLSEIRQVRNSNDLPIVIVTGQQESDNKRRALRLGATDLLSKPVETEDLVARLESMVQLKRVHDQLREINTRLDEKVHQRTEQVRYARLEAICRLAKAGEFRDEETGLHVARVGCYCRILAEAMNANSRFVERIALAGPLHDIGKIGVPGEVLLKRARLNPEERQLMQRHCHIGAEILLDPPRAMALHSKVYGAPLREQDGPADEVLEMAGQVARSHHERWDGSGYPQGLAGQEIPLPARITMVADIFDALGSERPYKPAFGPEKVESILREEAPGSFDPEVYEAFLRSRDRMWHVRELARQEEVAAA
jgi:putative two-component system response regulator